MHAVHLPTLDRCLTSTWSKTRATNEWPRQRDEDVIATVIHVRDRTVKSCMGDSPARCRQTRQERSHGGGDRRRSGKHVDTHNTRSVHMLVRGCACRAAASRDVSVGAPRERRGLTLLVSPSSYHGTLASRKRTAARALTENTNTAESSSEKTWD